jgi:hypothetical protein
VIAVTVVAMSRVKTFAGALTLVLLASCGGSAKKATPVAPPVSVAIATTAAPTTAAPTTVPAPTAPPTTAGATTTTMSLKDLEKVVRQAHAQYWVEALPCIARPSVCDPASFTLADSLLRARLLESTKALAEKNWIVRQNESDLGLFVVESVVLNESRTVATLKECLWDSAITLQPNAGPNGEDIIVDDSKSSFENTLTMVLTEGRWLMSDRREISRYEGVNKCAGR